MIQIESAKEHIEHILKIKGRPRQIAAMKSFLEWVADMPEFQRQIYLQDLLRAEHFLPDYNQKVDINILRAEAMIGLSDKARRVIEQSLENLHEEEHFEKEEPLE